MKFYISSSCQYEKNFGLAIDNELNFDVHIKNLHKVASAKRKGLGRIWKRLNILQAKMSYNSLILFQFHYSLIWMFLTKVYKAKLLEYKNWPSKQLYNEPNLNLDELVELGKSTAIHARNIVTLLIEMFKTTREEIPQVRRYYMNDSVITEGFRTS